MKLERISAGKKYRFKKKFYVEAPPLSWYAEKGEIALCESPSLGNAHLRGSDGRLILMSRKEAFDYLEEVGR